MSQTLRVPVALLYHSVRQVSGGSIYRISISPERFRRHVEFLTSRFRVVRLQDFVDALASRIRTEGMACITFDDGYVDNLTAASDILREYHTPATVFVPTGFIGRPYFWWDALHAIRGAASCSPGVGRCHLRIQFPALHDDCDTAEAEWFRVWDHLRRQRLEDTYEAVGELAARMEVDLAGLPRPIASCELQQLTQWPFEIGSHAVSHRPLSSLSIDEAASELTSSRSYLEGYTGRPVRAFSYPFGLFDHEVAQACRAAGYSCAVSLIRDDRISYSDLFDLPRLDGADGDVDELALELDRIEHRNSRAFGVHGAFTSRLVDARMKSDVGKPTPSRSLSPVGFRDSDLFRSTPVNRDWGWDRGVPLDRPFIEQFIRTHRGDMYGRILEIKEPEYSSRYARPGAQVDILDINSANKLANIIDDMQSCAQISDNTYDCVILTQVLQLVPDFGKAIATAARILKPGGVLLLTVCGITQGISSTEGNFCWSFFQPGVKHVLSQHFDIKKLLLHSHGNVGLAASFLMGLTVSDVPPDLLSTEDPEYPIVVTARAVKSFVVPKELTWSPAVEMPEISVVIPMFNAATTIQETLYSVSRQDYASYEVLIVDDGSTDGSRNIANEIAAKSCGRITVLEHVQGANRGLSLSRNLAITHARGEFLVFLDADDTIHPGKFFHDVNILRAHPEAAAVVGRALWWWDGEGDKDAHLDKIFEPHDRVVHPPEFFEANYQTMRAESPPCVHSWMVRRSAVDQIQPFDQYMMTYEDQKFLADLSLRFPIYVASTCLCDYRRKETTLWSTALALGTDVTARERFVEWKRRAASGQPATSHTRPPHDPPVS